MRATVKVAPTGFYGLRADVGIGPYGKTWNRCVGAGFIPARREQRKGERTMGFWIFCLAMNLLLPVIMLVFGRLFQTRPPKTINGLFGYRTARSMKSQEEIGRAHV